MAIPIWKTFKLFSEYKKKDSAEQTQSIAILIFRKDGADISSNYRCPAMCI